MFAESFLANKAKPPSFEPGATELSSFTPWLEIRSEKEINILIREGVTVSMSGFLGLKQDVDL